MKKRQPFIIAFVLGLISMPLYDVGFRIAWDGNPFGMMLAFSGFLALLFYSVYSIFYFINNDSPYKKYYRLSLILIPFAVLMGFLLLNMWYT